VSREITILYYSSIPKRQNFYRSNADFAEVQFRRPQTNDGIKITSNAVFHAESESDLGFVVGSMVKELLGDN
jgi:hypothetical protein